LPESWSTATTAMESPITVLKRLEKITTIDDKISEVRKVVFDNSGNKMHYTHVPVGY
jgi:hypothetical protein